MAEVTVREATDEDCEEIFRLAMVSVNLGVFDEDCEEKFCLAMELFEFENNAHNFKGTINSFRQDGFGRKRRFACVVAEDPNVSKQDHPKLVGFVLYTLLYKTGECGHVMHVEELYITEKYRRKGIGTVLMAKALQVAAEQRLLGVQLVARDFNPPAVKFYKKLGAINATETLGWRPIKLYEEKVKEHGERLEKSLSVGQESLQGGRPTVSGVSNIYVRDACVEDCGEILRLMQELASYLGEAERFRTDVDNIRTNGFGDEKNFQCIVAEEKDSRKPGENRLIGYLLYTWIYKAWLGRVVMHIEDIYISEGYRKKGIGTVFFEEAIKAARLKGYSHIQSTVGQKGMSAWNFFKKFGATDATEEHGMNLMIFENIR